MFSFFYTNLLLTIYRLPLLLALQFEKKLRKFKDEANGREEELQEKDRKIKELEELLQEAEHKAQADLSPPKTQVPKLPPPPPLPRPRLLLLMNPRNLARQGHPGLLPPGKVTLNWDQCWL